MWTIRLALAAWLYSADSWLASIDDSAASDCGPAVVGFNASFDSLVSSDALKLCGVALLRGAFQPEILRGLLEAFQGLPEVEAAELRHGSVRERRVQTHFPFTPPFDGLELLGASGQFLPMLASALGEHFVLDLVTVVAVPPGAAAQDVHRDTSLAGSVAVHIPLHPLPKDMAPLALCSGTHNLSHKDAVLVVREAMLWNYQDESPGDAKRRLFCGGRQKTTSFEISCVANVCASIRVRDSRLGASIAKFTSPEAEALQLQIGDEMTHANGRTVSSREDWMEIVEEAGQGSVIVQIERPHAGPLPSPPRLIVGAPLELGDALLYDSRTWHWGMMNQANETRYALYVNFKNITEHEGVHPEAHGSEALKIARKAFQARLLQLRGTWSGSAEL